MPMWVADMDLKCDESINRAIIDKANHGIYGYGSDFEDVYESAIRWMRDRHEISLKLEDFVYVPTIVAGINLLIRAMTKESDKILIVQPSYPQFISAIENNSRELVISNLVNEDRRYEIDFEDFESKLKDDTKLFILCNPHNPVARVFSEEEILRMIDLCNKYGVKIISDEIHMDLVFEAFTHKSLLRYKDKLKVDYAVCTSPSKTFNLAGLQLGFILSDCKQVRESLDKEILSSGMSMRPNVFAVEGVIAAYDKGYDWLCRTRSLIEDNYKFLTSYLSNNISKVKPTRMEGTYLVWLDFRDLGISDMDLHDILYNKIGLILNKGESFGKAGQGFRRLNIACEREYL